MFTISNGFRNNLRTLSIVLPRQRSKAIASEALNVWKRYQQFSYSIAATTSHLSLKSANAIPEIRNHLDVLRNVLSEVNEYADWETIRAEIQTREMRLSDEKLWLNDRPTALKINEQLSHLQKQVSTYSSLTREISEVQELATLVGEAEDARMQEDLINELESIRRRSEKYLITLRLSRPTDTNSAYIDIRAGSGGVEACDWAEMLARMYTRWAQSRGYTVQIVSRSPGEVAGIKEITILVKGLYAYGYAQYESGVHRLVRISPFSQGSSRHTSFASVRVSPYFEADSDFIGVELKQSDLKITTMRSQGAGGQHVNKTESAVRIVHIPSGITVLCQQERSQHSNKTLGLALLKSKLYDREIQKRAQLKADTHNALPENGWGSQIRSYILQPYQLVKDARTGHSVGSGGVQAVIDGDLDGFMEANLRLFRTKSGQSLQ